MEMKNSIRILAEIRKDRMLSLSFDNNLITEVLWGLKYSADYAFSKNLTGIFYFDYAFSDYAISTAFPQTTIRSGFTIRYNFGN